jgi:hypothetical protein
MKLYADLGTRRAGQLAGDLLLVVWVWVWARVGVAVHDAVDALGAVGQQVEEGGASLAGNLGEAARGAAAVPLVGDQLRAPFDAAAGAGRALAAAGRTQQEAVSDLALLLGWAIALVPIAVVVLFWVPRRVGFARRAGAARRHLASAGDLDLFALRAMTSQPMHRLARVGDDPVGGWRRGDAEVVRRLADLELRESGLRVPAHLAASGGGRPN